MTNHNLSVIAMLRSVVLIVFSVSGLPDLIASNTKGRRPVICYSGLRISTAWRGRGMMWFGTWLARLAFSVPFVFSPGTIQVPA